MNWREWFKKEDTITIPAHDYGQDGIDYESIYTEDLYQAFKERLLSEIVADDFVTIDGGNVYHKLRERE